MLVPGGLPGFPDDGDGYGLLQVKRRGMVSKISRGGPRLCREGEGERHGSSNDNLHGLPHGLGDDGELISPGGHRRRCILSLGE
jgi:hypothetical protein